MSRRVWLESGRRTSGRPPRCSHKDAAMITISAIPGMGRVAKRRGGAERQPIVIGPSRVAQGWVLIGTEREVAPTASLLMKFLLSSPPRQHTHPLLSTPSCCGATR